MFPFITVMVVCWIIFWLYWLISAFSSKRGRGSSVKQFVGIRIVILAVAAVTALLIKTSHSSTSTQIFPSSEVAKTIGLIIFLAGLAFAVWARIFLGKNWGMPMTQKLDPELVTSGPYRYVRHPIYTGVIFGALGSVITVSVYWLVPLVVFAVYFIYSATVEEKLMAKQFPKVYPDYKRKTKMLIPFIF